MTGEEQASLRLDCAGMSLRQLHDRLRETEPGTSVSLESLPSGLDSLGAGLDVAADFQTRGDLGDFVLMLSANSNWDIGGNVGVACGHSLVSSKLLIHGSAGYYFAAFAKGGFLAVHGRAGDGAGYALSGADALVRGYAGAFAGAYMTEGALVLANGCGENLGLGMMGGSIYLRGEAASLAPQLKKLRMKDADSMRLSLLLARARIRGNAREFKLYRTSREK